MGRGLRLLLEEQKDFQLVGEADDGREAIALAEKLKPDVAVLDITMPNLNGIEAARQITAKQAGVAIVILSMHSDEGYVLRALKAGARGYLLKESPDSDLLNAVRSVSQGKAFFSPVVSRLLVEDYVRQLQDKDTCAPTCTVTTAFGFPVAETTTFTSPWSTVAVRYCTDSRPCIALHAP